jgi:hypothetical protein
MLHVFIAIAMSAFRQVLGHLNHTSSFFASTAFHRQKKWERIMSL